MKVYILTVCQKTNEERLEYVYRVFKKEQDAINMCRFLAAAAAKSPNDVFDDLDCEPYHRIMVFGPSGYVCYSYDEEEVVE